MLMYGWMKFVELAPERYDWAVRLMTAGRLDRLKDRIAGMVNTNDRVLDIGCGTGTLALRMLRRGATVTGLDMSEHMLGVARKYADGEGLGSRLVLIKDSVTQLSKHAEPGSFDCIVCTMVLGELSSEYVKFQLVTARRTFADWGRSVAGKPFHACHLPSHARRVVDPTVSPSPPGELSGQRHAAAYSGCGFQNQPR